MKTITAYNGKTINIEDYQKSLKDFPMNIRPILDDEGTPGLTGVVYSNAECACKIEGCGTIQFPLRINFCSLHQPNKTSGVFSENERKVMAMLNYLGIEYFKVEGFLFQGNKETWKKLYLKGVENGHFDDKCYPFVDYCHEHVEAVSDDYDDIKTLGYEVVNVQELYSDYVGMIYAGVNEIEGQIYLLFQTKN